MPAPSFAARSDLADRELLAASLVSSDGAVTLPAVTARVTCDVDGFDHTTLVEQVFVNAAGGPLEVIYNFPLRPYDAVVEMTAVVAGRRVSGVLKRRDEARDEYATAVAEGRTAALVEEDRPSTFTTSLGNLPAGETVTVELRVVGRVDVDVDPAGGYRCRLRFPTVVAPRYTEGSARDGAAAGDGVADDTDLVPDASRVTPPVAVSAESAPRLEWSATVRSASGDVDDFGGTAPGELRFSTRSGALSARVAGVAACDRDVELDWLVPTSDVSVAAGVVRDRGLAGDRTARRQVAGDATVAVTVIPPAVDIDAVRGRDVVVLLDRSGSMMGWKMSAAASFASQLVEALNVNDRVAVATFDSVLDVHRSKLCAATSSERVAAAEWLRAATPRGGTTMSPAVQWACSLFDDPSRDRFLVLVTDGQVSGEDVVLRAVTSGVQVIAAGIDSAANLGLLERLAAATGGFSQVASSQAAVAELLDAALRRIVPPVLSDVAAHVVFSDGSRSEIVDFDPHARVFANVPATFRGRVTIPARRRPAKVEVSAVAADGTSWTTSAPLDAGSPAAAALWARRRVRELEDAWVSDTGLVDDVVAVSLGFGVLSRFTAFVAVDETGDPASSSAKRLVVPQAPPAAWNMMRSASFGAPQATSVNMMSSTLTCSGAVELAGSAVWGSTSSPSFTAGGHGGQLSQDPFWSTLPAASNVAGSGVAGDCCEDAEVVALVAKLIVALAAGAADQETVDRLLSLLTTPQSHRDRELAATLRSLDVSDQSSCKRALASLRRLDPSWEMFVALTTGPTAAG